jgi:hypothetical protein
MDSQGKTSKKPPTKTKIVAKGTVAGLFEIAVNSGGMTPVDHENVAKIDKLELFIKNFFKDVSKRMSEIDGIEFTKWGCQVIGIGLQGFALEDGSGDTDTGSESHANSRQSRARRRASKDQACMQQGSDDDDDSDEEESGDDDDDDDDDGDDQESGSSGSSASCSGSDDEDESGEYIETGDTKTRKDNPVNFGQRTESCCSNSSSCSSACSLSSSSAAYSTTNSSHPGRAKKKLEDACKELSGQKRAKKA